MKLKFVVFLLVLLLFTHFAQANIYEWAISGGSVVQSSTLCPSGSGVSATPGANFSGLNLTQAYLIAANLANSSISSGTLTNANMTGANLMNADCGGVVLANANLTGANLAGASLGDSNLANANFTNVIITGATFGASSLTSSQLYSTASYKARNLQAIQFSSNDLTGWDFSGQDLTSAVFIYGIKFTGTNFTNATVTGADFSFCYSTLTSSVIYSTSSYKAKNLQGVSFYDDNLTGWDFSGQNLTGANLGGSVLTGANFTNAIVAGVSLGSTYFTSSQLYSTASYKAGNLQGIVLGSNDGVRFGDDLTAWDLSGQNLTGANLGGCVLTGANFTNAIVARDNFSTTGLSSSQLYSTASYKARNLEGISLGAYPNRWGDNLTGWDLSGQNLSDANFAGGTLTGTNLTGADMRGATGFSTSSSGAISTNAILPDGTIQGLTLNSSNSCLLVRNYDGGIPILVQQYMSMTASASLVFALDGNPWGSTIAYSPAIPVALGGGNLTLGLASGVASSAVSGSTLQLFNWSSVTPSGQFTVVDNLGLPVDASQLYTTGHLAVFGHAVPILTVSGGSNQTVILGANALAGGLTLSNGTSGQTGLASLDVNSLGLNVSGSTGGRLVASGASQHYAASFSTSAVGVQSEVYSVNIGDDHTLLGASTDTNVSTMADLTVLDHAAAAFGDGGDTLNLSFGTVHYGMSSLQYRIENLHETFRAALDLDSVLTLSNLAGVFSTDAMPFTDLPAGELSNELDLLLNASASQLGDFSGQYQFNLSDEKDINGHAGQQTLTLNVTATVVPEPGTLAMLEVFGVGIVCLVRMRRKPVR